MRAQAEGEPGRTSSDVAAAPVFVVGSPRSGTTLLYHQLVSAGAFVNYRVETLAYNLIRPAYRDLRSERDRERFLADWLRGFLFARSGLDADEAAVIVRRSRSTGEFLRGLMDAMALRQGKPRWAECTPDHGLYLPDIAADFPTARIVHIVRDGRDVAASLERQGWIRPLPGDAARGLETAGCYWSWVVERTRRAGAALGDRYVEVRFERLVAEPARTLAELGRSIDHYLDHERIRRDGIGSVHAPNSSFRTGAGADSSPVGRWRSLPAARLGSLERDIGATLERFGYERSQEPTRLPSLRRRLLHARFSTRHRLRATSLGPRLIDASPIVSDSPVA